MMAKQLPCCLAFKDHQAGLDRAALNQGREIKAKAHRAKARHKRGRSKPHKIRPHKIVGPSPGLLPLAPVSSGCSVRRMRHRHRPKPRPLESPYR